MYRRNIYTDIYIKTMYILYTCIYNRILNRRDGSTYNDKTALPRTDGQMKSFGKTTFGHVAGVFVNGLDTFGGNRNVHGAGSVGRGHDGVAQRP